MIEFAVSAMKAETSNIRVEDNRLGLFYFYFYFIFQT